MIEKLTTGPQIRYMYIRIRMMYISEWIELAIG